VLQSCNNRKGNRTPEESGMKLAGGSRQAARAGAGPEAQSDIYAAMLTSSVAARILLAGLDSNRQQRVPGHNRAGEER